MDIGEVLRRAWQIIWRHKILWLFGILASCGSSGDSNTPQFSFGMERRVPFEHVYPNLQLEDWQIALIVLAILAVVFLLIVITIFLSTMGRIGLIRGTQQADASAEQLSFGELFQGGMPYFWRVFGLNLLVGIGFFVVALAIMTAFVIGAIVTLGLGLLCIIPLVCLLVPVAWFATVIVDQAINAIVIEDRGVLEGLQSGWDIVRSNLGVYVVMALILVLGALVVQSILVLPMVFILAPPLVAFLTGNGELASLIVSGVFFLAYLLVLIVLSGILRSYIGASWTLTYLRLSRPASDSTEIEAVPA